jgi:hypothetical protein
MFRQRRILQRYKGRRHEGMQFLFFLSCPPISPFSASSSHPPPTNAIFVLQTRTLKNFKRRLGPAGSCNMGLKNIDIIIRPTKSCVQRHQGLNNPAKGSLRMLRGFYIRLQNILGISPCWNGKFIEVPEGLQVWRERQQGALKQYW